MNLKQRFALYFSVLFTLILGLVLFILLTLFVSFRRAEFRLRLEEKATSSINLLTNLPDLDKQILSTFDQNTINKLYNEKTLIFNDKMQLIYSSIDDAVVKWKLSDLEYLQKNKHLFRYEGEYDVVGVYKKSSKCIYYYAIIGAEDKYGNRQLEFLEYALFGVFLLGAVGVWVLSYYVSKKSFLVLDKLKNEITEINEKKLHYRIEEGVRKDEISDLTRAFNSMLDRLDVSYKKQKEFIYNASHELRTPVSRIVMQLQNLSFNEDHSETTQRYLKSLLDDANQMTDLISSLLLLSKIEEFDNYTYLPLCRIDEIIFDALGGIKKSYPDFHIRFNAINNTEEEDNFDVKGDYNLLKIVFTNLLKNAYNYSSNKQVDINIHQHQDELHISLINEGKTISLNEQENIFKAFVRGRNSQKIEGTGLGLRIVERILHFHKAEIAYDTPIDDQNRFTIIFPLG